jgi:hypothetical protein
VVSSHTPDIPGFQDGITARNDPTMSDAVQHRWLAYIDYPYHMVHS